MKQIPDFSDILDAQKRIKSFAHKTPVLCSSAINDLLGVELFFKCENFQKVGAFKFRGACNAVFSLKDRELKKGVITHSSGNHAAALALVAKMKGVPAYIVMPENSPEIKKKAVAGYGAQITFCKPTLEARETTSQEIIQQTKALFIHPYNHPDIIAGQGTAALELCNEVPDLEIVMAPVGGGGLLSGTAIASKQMIPGAKVYAAEPAGADDAYRSFYTGHFTPSENPQTIADGLLTSLGSLTWEVIQKNVDAILRVHEEKIIEAMRLIWERMKIIIEPSSAVPLAAILENPLPFRNKKTGIILSGGNVDLERLPF